MRIAFSVCILLPLVLIASTVPAEQAAEDEQPKNTIRWTTASELDNFGFDIFRGDSPKGPFEQINAETIEGQGTTDEPSNYAYEDRTIDPCRTYYYYVESISMSGIREHFTPVGKAGAKWPAEDPRCSSKADPEPEPAGDESTDEGESAGEGTPG